MTPLLLLCALAHAAPEEQDLPAPDAEQKRLEALVEAAGVLLDPRLPAERRLQAAEALAATGDPRAVAILAGGVDDRDPAVQRGTLAAAGRSGLPDAAALGALALRGPYDDEVRRAAIPMLEALGLAEAGQVLLDAVRDPDLPDALRAEALAALRRGWPELAGQVAEVTITPFSWGMPLVVAADATAASVVLWGVGTLGQSTLGAVIGALGGAGIGVGTGVLEIRARPPDLGQGLLRASGTGWGVATGTWVALANQGDLETSAAIVASTTALGAGYGWWRSRAHPRPGDVVEVNVAGLLAGQLAEAVAQLATTEGASSATAATTRWTTTAPYGPTTPGGATGPGDTADTEPATDARDPDRAARWGALAGGSLAGLAAGWPLSRPWSLDGNDALLGAMAALEGLWAGGWLASLWDTPYAPGSARFGMAAGAALALGLAEAGPTQAAHGLGLFEGAIVGNAVGAGAALLAGDDAPERVAPVMVPAGLAGAALGAIASPRFDRTGTDAAAISLLGAATTWQSIALATRLAEQDVLAEDGQPLGLVLAASGGSVLAGEVLATRLEFQRSHVAFAASLYGWGAWAGAMVPLALDVEGTAGQILLSSALTGDAFLAAGAVAVSPLLGLDPGVTLWPQLGALSGATLGAVGTGLVTGDLRLLSWGTLGGAALGAAGGAIFQRVRGDRPVALGLPALHLPRPGLAWWTPTMQVLPGDDGEPIPAFGLAAGF